jgi:hypothetical protein
LIDTSVAVVIETVDRRSLPRELAMSAVTLAHQLPLYTLNAADLRGLEELIEIVDLG